MRKILKDKSVRTMAAVIASVLLSVMIPSGDELVQAAGSLVTSKTGEVIVIDPGHGGFDGGAESESGTCEKDINLAIALELRELLEEDGYRVIMTRETDEALGETGSSAIRSRKTADLIARKNLIDEKEPYLTVSIHLNSFKEDRSVHGAQVFYPAGDEEDQAVSRSMILAEKIRTELIRGIDDGTERASLAKNDVRILKNVRTPIVLVECGFLSNYEEAKRLENVDYQRKIAVCIRNGIIQYTNCK